MPAWTATGDTLRSGTAETTADAWDAAYSAAADCVRAGHLDTIIATVDGQAATITPSRSGQPEHDITATLEAIESTRLEVVAAYREASQEPR
jgi:hypothetical protein